MRFILFMINVSTLSAMTCDSVKTAYKNTCCGAEGSTLFNDKIELPSLPVDNADTDFLVLGGGTGGLGYAGRIANAIKNTKKPSRF